MTPTTRNTLIVGGAAIVVALLLTCGPMRGLFGAGDAGETPVVETPEPAVEAPPAVAAGPPPEPPSALGAAASGALAGSQAGTSPDLAAAGSGAGSAAATATGANAAGAASAPSVSGTGSGTKRVAPPVSAGPPSVPVAAAVAAVPAIDTSRDAENAAVAFDESFGDLSVAGPVVDRFAPPVAAVMPSALALNVASRNVGLPAGSIRQPCDSPGAGCQNTPIPPGPIVIPGPPGRP